MQCVLGKAIKVQILSAKAISDTAVTSSSVYTPSPSFPWRVRLPDRKNLTLVSNSEVTARAMLAACAAGAAAMKMRDLKMSERQRHFNPDVCAQADASASVRKPFQAQSAGYSRSSTAVADRNLCSLHHVHAGGRVGYLQDASLCRA